MMYLGQDAIGLNSFISKNIPAKWDIIEYIPDDTNATKTIYHSLGVIPDLLLVIPDIHSGTGSSNPIVLLGSNGTTDTAGRYRLVTNYISTTGGWDYTANPVNCWCEKDNEKIVVYSNTAWKINKKYYIIVIKFNEEVTSNANE